MATSPRLSIGARLTLWYTAAMAVTVVLVAVFVYTQVAARINREARLLIEVQARELASAYRGQLELQSPERSLGWLAGHMEGTVARSDPSLRLGMELVSAEGERVLAAGFLDGVSAPISTVVLDGRSEELLRAVDLDMEFPFLSLAIRVPGGAIQVVVNTERYADNIRHIRDVFLLSVPFVLVLAAAAGWFLSGRSLRPISRITQTAQRISGANLDESIPLTGSGDELDQLAETLNDMVGRIRDSMGHMRRFNANAAHELRTPLAAISSQVEVTLEKEREDSEYRAVLSNVLDRVQHLGRGVDAMLRLSRTEAGLEPANRTPIPMPDILETVHEFFLPLAQENGVDLVLGDVPDVRVMGDVSWLHQLFSNLVSNAVKYTPSGGRVTSTGRVDSGELRIDVTDTGRGIAPSEIARIFERYQRASEDRSQPGFGLGLPIAREIARAHGGRIEVESQPERGTCVSVLLPIT